MKPGEPSFGANCLLARRLAERGVRFIQLYHTNWDSHGRPGENRATVGRDHHVDAFTMWLAGGGTKPGLIFGETDELGSAWCAIPSTSTTCTPRCCISSALTTSG